VSVAVNNSSSANGSDPLLYGQTEAYADPLGVITITDMMLRAVPGPYTLTVSLPDYPTSQVSVLGQHQWLFWHKSLPPRHCYSQCSIHQEDCHIRRVCKAGVCCQPLLSLHLVLSSVGVAFDVASVYQS